MSERAAPAPAPALPPSTLSAGALLREARQARGVHIAAMAAALKVAPRKLEALENDRFDDLIDAAFARALAQSVCRHLHLDPEAVLARLPQPPAQRLDHATRGLDEPFREASGPYVAREPAGLLRPVVWGPLLIVLAAVGLLLLPPNLLRDFATRLSGSEPAASAVAVESPAATPPASAPAAALAALEPAASAAAVVPAAPPAEAVAPLAAAAAAEPPIVITARADSWVEVVDGASALLINRTVPAGETVRLDGTPPFRVKVGNAAGTDLRFRGQPIDLPATTRNNVARLELK